jgi:hypothetical protein
MSVVRERALLARTLLLEMAVESACEAGALDLAAVEVRRTELAGQWPDGIDPEQLLDTRSGLIGRLEQALAFATAQRRAVAEMRERARATRAEAIVMRERARTSRSRHLANAHEALALLALLDADVFEASEEVV